MNCQRIVQQPVGTLPTYAFCSAPAAFVRRWLDSFRPLCPDCAHVVRLQGGTVYPLAEAA